jgi:hypothetical protein
MFTRRTSDSTPREPSAGREEERTEGIVDPIADFIEEELDVHKPTAPVRFPQPNELEVRLVNVAELQRLDELRGDVSIFSSLFWTLIGGIIGFLGNLAASEAPLDGVRWMFLGLVAAFAAIIGALLLRAGGRAAAHRRRLFQDEPGRNHGAAASTQEHNDITV